ncbi:MAG: hypothetical protein ABI325_12045 [Ginsengibacter sp.]
MKNRFSFFIPLLFGISFPVLLMGQRKPEQKKLIEFGWDYPTVSYLKAHIHDMQKAPFDGVVFSFDFDIYNSFDTTQHKDSQFQYDDLSKIDWKNFTDNFILMRGVGYSGAQWLDDMAWLKIVINIKKVSKALSVSQAVGIGFDPEYYLSDSTLNPWVYRPSWYNNLSYKDVGDYVRKRGIQFIQALQTDKPDVKILCFWLLGLVDMQAKILPIAETGMALYPFFIEGMLEGKNKTSEIIDGNESSYWYQKPEDFIMAGEHLRENGSQLITNSLQPEFKNISLAQSVYFDGLYARLPRFDKGFNKETKERWLTCNLYNAYKTTDEYVWFYSEDINWWKNKVDSGVAKLVIEVKNKIKAEKSNSGIRVKGKNIGLDFKRKEQDADEEFYYTYTKTSNSLLVKFFSGHIKNLKVFSNSRLIYNVDNPPGELTINLTKRYDKKGNLIILATDDKQKASVAYVN